MKSTILRLCVAAGLFWGLAGTEASAQEPQAEPPAGGEASSSPAAEPAPAPAHEEASSAAAAAEPAAPAAAAPATAETTAAKPEEMEQSDWVEGQPAPDGEAIGIPMNERDEEFKEEVITPEDDKALDAATASHDPKVFAEELRKLITKVRAKVVEKIEAKIDAKQGTTMARLAMGLGIFSALGLLLLLTPIFLGGKYPGKAGLLFKYGALAAVTFVVAVNLFGGLLIGLKTVQGQVGKATNPQIHVVTAALDTLYDRAEEFAPMGAAIIKPTLEQVQSGDTDDPVPSALLHNMARFARSVAGVAPTIISLWGFFKFVNMLMGYLPLVLTIVAVLLLGLAIRPTLMEIIKLPARAASGEGTAAGTLGNVFKRVKGELWTTLALIVVLVVVMQVAGFLMSISIVPAVQTFLEYMAGTFLYIQHNADASGTNILIGLGATIFFLVLDILVVILATAFVIGKTQKIFQDRFHNGTPLSTHKKFFVWGYAGVLLNLALPVGFVFGARPLILMLVEKSMTAGEAPNWTMFFILPPLALVLGFIVVWWALRGMKALGFIRKWPVKKIGQADPPVSVKAAA